LVQQQLSRQWISGPSSCTFLSMETHYHEANHAIISQSFQACLKLW